MAKVRLYQSKTWMERKFYKERKTPEQVAKEAKCGVSTIYEWMNKHGIKYNK